MTVQTRKKNNKTKTDYGMTDMDVNKNTVKINGLGYVAYAKLINNRKSERLEIIFTKGKLELEISEVDRINVYDNSMNIFYKDKRIQYVNLDNVTYME